MVRPPMTEVSLVTRSCTLKYGFLSPNAAARPRRCSSSCTSGKRSTRQVDSSTLGAGIRSVVGFEAEVGIEVAVETSLGDAGTGVAAVAGGATAALPGPRARRK